METLALAACDSEDPETHLAGFRDGLIEDPGHRIPPWPYGTSSVSTIDVRLLPSGRMAQTKAILWIGGTPSGGRFKSVWLSGRPPRRVPPRSEPVT